jgi:hypothetical protein
MKTKVLLATALMLAMAFALAVPAETNDASVISIVLDGDTTIKTSSGDTVTLTFNYETDRNDTMYVVAYYVSDGKAVGPYTKDDPLSVKLKSGEGSFDMDLTPQKQGKIKMTFVNDSGKSVYSDMYLSIEFSTSLWGNWTTYAAIIVVVILIVALVVYKSRLAPAKEKNTLTFEQIEAEKQAQKTATKQEAPSAAKSERQRYLASKKK